MGHLTDIVDKADGALLLARSLFHPSWHDAPGEMWRPSRRKEERHCVPNGHLGDSFAVATANVFHGRYPELTREMLMRLRDRYPDLTFMAVQEGPSQTFEGWGEIYEECFPDFQGVFAPNVYFTKFDGAPSNRVTGNWLFFNVPASYEIVDLPTTWQWIASSRLHNGVVWRNSIVAECSGEQENEYPEKRPVTVGTTHLELYTDKGMRAEQLAATLHHFMEGTNILLGDLNLLYRGLEPSHRLLQSGGLRDLIAYDRGINFTDYVVANAVSLAKKLPSMERSHNAIAAQVYR